MRARLREPLSIQLAAEACNARWHCVVQLMSIRRRRRRAQRPSRSRNAPLWDGTARGQAGTEIFCKWCWTDKLQNSPSRKSVGLSVVARRAKAESVRGRLRVRDWRRMHATVSPRHDDYAMSASEDKADLIQRQANVRLWNPKRKSEIYCWWKSPNVAACAPCPCTSACRCRPRRRTYPIRAKPLAMRSSASVVTTARSAPAWRRRGRVVEQVKPGEAGHRRSWLAPG
jgi:hypothetical protein